MSTSRVLARKYVFQKYFHGLPKRTDLKLVEEELPPIKDGEFLAEAKYLSVDPYMRAYAPRLKLGTTFIGGQIAQIIESKNSKYPKDKLIHADFGWRTHTICDDKLIESATIPPYILPNFGNLPLSYGLGILGMPGNTAYFGFLGICKPKSGETVVVTGAAGAVGTIVGQLAKIQGCKVIGIAGSDEKGKWLIDELKFDHFINYKTDNISKLVDKYAGDGVDCYFDNVGGEISSIILSKMNAYGRISVCGAISGYNATEIPKATIVQVPLVMKQLKMEGFLVWQWKDRWLEGIEYNLKLLNDGKLQYHETITNGFDKTFDAFIDMLNGKNVGKAIVKI